MATTLFTTKVNLGGLMEVLSKNLYSTPTVAIRELVQNAHDACVRRKIESQEPFEPKISVITSQSKSTLTIEDNGAGLTHDEITDFLATVGSGYTRVLRDQQVDETMIGYFGLGFLSAYVVSKRLEVWTTSYKEPDKGWHFISKDAERYSIQEVPPRQIGMRVVMHLSSNFQALADTFVIEKLLLRYCSLLPVPIYLNHQHNVALNDEPPPWQIDTESLSPIKLKKQRLQFAQRFENEFEPLCAIPIHPTETSEARGLLWIQDAWTYGTSDNRNLTVFIRNMFISSDVRELLPVWAGFIGGVIESNELTPTASREDIQKDKVYEAIAEQIKESLIDGLAKMPQEDFNNWQRLLKRHNEALLGAALCNNRLLRVLAKDLKVPTSEGDLTVPAVLGRSENKIYVSIGEEGSYEEVLFRALMTPIVSGVRYAALPFCERYTELFGGKVVKLGTQKGNAVLFKKEVINPEEQEKLQSLLAQEGQQVIPSRFKPSYLPMVLIPDREYQLKQRMESEELDRRISKGVLSLARLHTKKIQSEIASYFYVNLDSPLIQRLLIIEGDKQQQIANLLRSFSIMMIRHHETEQDIDLSETLATFSDSILQLTEK
ncbi:ATP-binding protein [Candidatus Parabeggiatoa sp. HSG14]|uniref:ATP-binding protein n=1 Tax=Candidatus Parabeggiatoa sp. HSG14 TaxID=3055593 RepID=UPI0025A70D1F|nr:ATP-binding protein [Thiotrichales bacterium HSG14]